VFDLPYLSCPSSNPNNSPAPTSLPFTISKFAFQPRLKPKLVSVKVRGLSIWLLNLFDMAPKVKKGRRKGDDSSDEEGELSKGLKAVEVTASTAKEGKKDKKKEKSGGGKKAGGKGHQDSDDEDPLAIMKRLAAAAESSDDEPSPPVPVPAPAPKKSAPPSAPAPAPASAPTKKMNEDDDDDDESDDDNKKGGGQVKTHGKMSKAERKKQKLVQKGKSSQVLNSTQIVPDKEDEEDEDEDEETNDQCIASSESPAVPVPLSTQVSSSNTSSSPSQAVPSAAPTATAAAAAAPAAAKEVPKTKLQLKLEKARAEKAAADEAKKIADAAKADEEKKLAKEAKREHALAEAEAKATALSSAASTSDSVAATLPREQDNKEKEKEKEKEEETLTEAEKEARLKATMFGDDVFDEYARPNQEQGGDDGGLDASGKKLSRKELRRKAQEAEAKEREIEYNKAMIKASAEGAQFAVSQSIVDPNDPQWLNALDVVIPSISISAHSKELFVNTELNIAHGRRYGLVGPNGAGKSTLLKMIAAGELKLPPRIDFLYVEQEVVADETPAVDAVLRADKVRWALIEEEKTLLKELELRGANEALDVRLGEVYEQLANIGASSAEARARRILFGLGFDAEMQVRPTKYFSGGWRMRISLARALFIEPTLLMLDEVIKLYLMSWYTTIFFATNFFPLFDFFTRTKP